MAILLTGATGHLGPHLIAALLRARDFGRVYVLSRSGDPACMARVRASEVAARELIASEGSILDSGSGEVVPIAPDAIDAALGSIAVIVHAAADTRLAAPLDVLRSANVETTRALCRIAERCPKLTQFLHVSTACVAGRRSGVVPESLTDGSHGFCNDYEQTKWQAEATVAASGLPARIARLSTCVGGDSGYVHRFGALHHVLHWISRGLIPMVPGDEATPVDLISTDVAGRWLARAAACRPDRLDVCHVALGSQPIPLGTLLNFAVPLLQDGGRRLAPPALVDERTFADFQRMVRVSGDALFLRIQTHAAAVLPALLHPKTYETASAERCWRDKLPHSDWQSLVARVIAFARARSRGSRAAEEGCHA